MRVNKGPDISSAWHFLLSFALGVFTLWLFGLPLFEAIIFLGSLCGAFALLALLFFAWKAWRSA
ncbi:MAG: hypothetical protein L0170_18345 [Acidobacteria bacterium]|nr:hypothetical protein [Acidobacteriota bacterium]